MQADGYSHGKNAVDVKQLIEFHFLYNKDKK
jgi:hypothetical protein